MHGYESQSRSIRLTRFGFGRGLPRVTRAARTVNGPAIDLSTVPLGVAARGIFSGGISSGAEGEPAFGMLLGLPVSGGGQVGGRGINGINARAGPVGLSNGRPGARWNRTRLRRWSRT